VAQAEATRQAAEALCALASESGKTWSLHFAAVSLGWAKVLTYISVAINVVTLVIKWILSTMD
jgi:hypothetical protein